MAGAVALVLAVASGAGLSGCGSGDADATDPTGPAGIPTVDPPDGRKFEFVEVEAMDGSHVTVEPGEFTIVNFWYSTCGPCAREMPALAEVASTFDGRIGFVGFNPLDDADAASSFLDRYGTRFPTYLDDGDQVQAAGIVSFPFTFFLRDGRIVDQHVGEITREELLERIAARFGLVP